MEFQIIVLLMAIFLVSIGAGTFGAIVGLGGGIIIVPVLTLFFKVNVHYAIGASIVSVIATSSGASATYIKSNISNLKVGLYLEMATTVGALTGAFIGAYLDGSVIFLIFGLVLGFSAILLWQKRNEELPHGVESDNWSRKLKLGSSYYDRALNREIKYEVRGTRSGLAMMYGAGIISGLLGIGSGALKVLAMDIAMRLPVKVSSATSNFMIGVTAATSAGVYLARGYINPYFAAPVALGVLLGSIAGTRLLMVLNGTVIRKVFIVVLIILTLQMILKGIGIGV